METIFQAKNIEIKFSLRGKEITAVRNCSLDIYKGEALAIVGESGSGKSVFTKSFLGMLDKNGRVTKGELLYHGEDLVPYTTEKQWLGVRGRKIAIVFQDPMTSLNPLKTVGEQIREVITWHRGLDHQAAKQEALELLRLIGIPDPDKRYRQYPHEFSGGMRQRVVIASAIACRPEILICDEPTTALDVTIQAQILELIKELQQKFQMTVVYITHDLGVVANVADRVAVMYAGQIVEYGMTEEIFHDARHPYTRALLRSLPQLGVKGEPLEYIHGTPPSLDQTIVGDAFAPRNPDALEIDVLEEPPFFKVSETHYAKTWLLHPDAAEAIGEIEAERQVREAKRRNEPQESGGGVVSAGLPLVQLRDLTVRFKMKDGYFTAVDHVNLDIRRGEILSLVGESGSGKTTIGRAIAQIQPISSGEIIFDGEWVDPKWSKKQKKRFRRRVQMIFQDPMASLNERAKIDYIISEGLYNQRLYDSEQDRLAKVTKAMEDVGLLPQFINRFPHEFSGGQRQRIGIARALVLRPEFIIADEPISALDVSIRAQIINILNRLKKENGLTYLFIAHDLSVVRFLSDRIAVIHKGKIVELAESEELFERPLHPYTKALLSAIPIPNPQREKEKVLIHYDPSMHSYDRDKPVWTEIRDNHFVLANQEELDRMRAEIDRLEQEVT
ncbi:MAG: ABC transporter ATP-binding protein [Bacillota bacterium]|nr:ABC transporter ATP-binding protein [Bacillota bacterium]